MSIAEWIDLNKLTVNWIAGKIFEIDKMRFLVLDDKKGKIISDAFDLIIDDFESKAFLEKECTHLAFEFGEKWYYCTPEKLQLNQLVYLGRSNEVDVDPFPFLAIHGGFELCNGSRMYGDWCDKASFLNIDTLGICERNTLAGTLPFQIACEKRSIKSILGETIDVKIGQLTYRVKLYVQNEKGWSNLLWLNKIINVDREYEHYVTQGELFERNEGLICVLNSFCPIDSGLIKKYKYYFAKRVYFQFDLFEYSSNQKDKEHLLALEQYYKKYLKDLPPILIQDAYYLEANHGYIKKKLNAIGRVTSEFNSEDQYFKSSTDTFSEWCSMFKEDEDMFDLWQNCIENVSEVSGSCNFRIGLGELHLPKYKMTENQLAACKDEDSLFWNLIEEGLQSVDENEIDCYIDRVQREVEVIDKGGFRDYFLILWDIVEWCRSKNILTGVGRGSAGGSLVAYLLKITQIDPIEHNLLFERFLNEGRLGKSLPDIDTDFEGERRNEVKRYIEERYGVENVCSIGTYGTLKIKAAIQDLSRIYGIESKTRNFITKRIDGDGENWDSLFEQACQKMTLKDFIQNNYDLINDIPLLINQPKTQSIHAAGVIITPSVYNNKEMTIYDWMPVKKMDGILVSEWEGPLLEMAGFLKEDILGIKQLDKFSNIFKLMEENGKKRIEFEDIDYNDHKVLDLFKKGLNQDLFHFGSTGLTGYSQDVKPDSFEELIAMIALYRPGVMESGGHINYVKIKEGKKDPEYDFGLKHITESTYSQLIYQEQIMQAVVDLGGFTLTEADGIRKAMGKKIVEKMASYEQKFIEGAVERGCDVFQAKEIWNKLALFAGYGFNRSHAAAYAMTGYFCQYLKYYHPMEFWTTALQYASDSEIAERIGEIHKMDSHLKIESPDINESEAYFKPDFENQTIHWALDKIRYIGPSAVSEIIEERKEDGRFYSLEDFCERVEKRVVNKRALLHLILSGCFDKIHNIEKVQDRMLLINQYYDLIKEQLSETFSDKNIWREDFWILLQKQLSGSGVLDFNKVISRSSLKDAQAKYITPSQLYLEDNLDKRVVVSGIIHKIIRKVGKKAGSFAHLSLESNGELFTATLWNDVWEEYKNQLKDSAEGSIAIISGRVRDDSWRKERVIHSEPDSEIQII